MNNIIKKQFVKALAVLAVFASAISLASCGGSGDSSAATSPISVITREEGSGTRSAFIELFGVQDSDKVDHTTDQASVNNSTAVVMTSVQSDKNAIGYISMGSLNDSVKALKINGVDATVDNVKNDTYAISRPFNVVTQQDISDAATEFEAFLASAQAAEVVSKAGYIADPVQDEYVPSEDISGKVSIGGSSSVSPLMEKLVEKFKELNSNIAVEVQTSDSSTGINGAIAGTFDIAMSSRELKQSEIDKNLVATTIAIDGLAVIVNTENTVDDLTEDQVKQIYTGEILNWGDLQSN